MALVGFTWYQGEANVDERRGDEGAARYACTFPGMITQWREAFAQPDAYFGFVQLSTWCGDGELIAEMRTDGQMAALALPKVGYATNADHGAGCKIHPLPKQYCAKRLAASAMALEYGKPVAWSSPSLTRVAARLRDAAVGARQPARRLRRRAARRPVPVQLPERRLQLHQDGGQVCMGRADARQRLVGQRDDRPAAGPRSRSPLRRASRERPWPPGMAGAPCR